MTKTPAGQKNGLARHTQMIVLDILLTLVILSLFSPLLTGLALHELAGILFFLLMVLHLLFSWAWVTKSIRRVTKENNRRTQINFLLNALLFVLVVLQVVAGLSISQVTLPSLGIQTINDSSWRSLHNTCYQLIVIIISLHIALNLPRLIRYFGKRFFSWQQTQKNLSSGKYVIKRSFSRIAVIVLFAIFIAAVAYTIIGFPDASRLNTTDEIRRFRPRTISGLVQYTGAGIVLTILVYMAWRWLKLRL